MIRNTQCTMVSSLPWHEKNWNLKIKYNILCSWNTQKTWDPDGLLQTEQIDQQLRIPTTGRLTQLKNLRWVWMCYVMCMCDYNLWLCVWDLSVCKTANKRNQVVNINGNPVSFHKFESWIIAGWYHWAVNSKRVDCAMHKIYVCVYVKLNCNLRWTYQIQVIGIHIQKWRNWTRTSFSNWKVMKKWNI